MLSITGLRWYLFGFFSVVYLPSIVHNMYQVWDLRQMKDPLKVFEDLPNNYAQTNIAFSPDEQLFLTGTSIERESTTGGLLCFFDRAKLELISKVGISPTCSVVQCTWHPKLNQVILSLITYVFNQSFSGVIVDLLRSTRHMHIF